MKRTLLIISSIILIAGCNQDQQSENCLIGTWSNNGSCQVATKYIFNANNTGYVLQDNCSSSCINGSEWRFRMDFDYELTNAGLTFNYSDQYSCDSLLSNQTIQPLTVTASCENDILVVGGSTYLRQ